LCAGDAGGATDGPAQVWDGVITSKPESHAATKWGHGAPKPAGISAESAHRTCKRWLCIVGERELRDCDKDRLSQRWADWGSEEWRYWLHDGRSGSGASGGLRC